MVMRCYACEREAVSREHAPPLCIFPESADAPTHELRRKNLITVPACDDHNLRKSKDDEYLMMVLVAHFENNELSKAQASTKVSRAWQRRPHLASMAVRNPIPIELNGQQRVAFQVDSERFDRAMELIAKALVFHEYGRRWNGPCHVWSPSMLPSNPATTEQVSQTSKAMLEAIPQVFSGKPLLGANPETFQYRINLPQAGEKLGLVEMRFYEGFQVLVMLGAGVEA
jgi:hypothetical protein